MQLRPADVEADIHALVAFTEASVAEAGQTGHLHPGDVMHRIFSGLRHEAREELVWIWEDDDGIAGWFLVTPNHNGFDLEVRPDLRRNASDIERHMIDVAGAESEQALRARDRWAGKVVAETYASDDLRIRHLEALGYTRGHDPYLLTARALDDIPEPVLPEGYVIRAVTGVDEADAVGEVHSAAFRSKWGPGQYAEMMATPVYDPERELVVVAPNGSLAGFTMVWFDHTNRTGLFEPVGVHPDHQRRGLGRALMTAGMGAMRDAGMQTAMVAYDDENEASGPMYRGMGFVPRWELIDYRLEIGD